MNKDINMLIEKYELGEIEVVEQFNSLQNRVFRLFTDKGKYVIKEFSRDAIGSYHQLQKRKKQIEVSKLFNKKGIKCCLPISMDGKEFLYSNGRYYLIYDYLDYRPLDSKDVTLEHINVLSTTQARIHKIKNHVTLTCSYKKIKIDFDKQLAILKKKDKEAYDVLSDNIITMINMVNECNSAIRVLKRNLCIGHNDYKLLNILWKDTDMVLIDFDALGLSNPTISLCESAFTFARMGKRINYDFYEAYLRGYIKEYGKIKENYKAALIASFNGKLQWLCYMFSKNHLRKDNYIDDVKSMINELVLYYKNIDKFNRIYEKIISEIN